MDDDQTENGKVTPKLTIGSDALGAHVTYDLPPQDAKEAKKIAAIAQTGTAMVACGQLMMMIGLLLPFLFCIVVYLISKGD